MSIAKKIPKGPPTSNDEKRFPLVAIGASAGGLEAITEILQHVSPNTGMAFVFIQHLDPTHKSMLSVILAKVTTMMVLEATDQIVVKPDHVYIIPPDKDMSLTDGIISLKPRAPRPVVHLPIDHFFSSLAELYKDEAIGIVLSGNGSDGSFGLKMIKKAGGITIVQDASAKFQGMPAAAIAEVGVDFVLSPHAIAGELNRIAHLYHQERNGSGVIEKEGADTDEEELSAIVLLLKNATGVDFSHYKINTVRRRVIRRMLVFQLDTLKQYHLHLKEHLKEMSSLYEDLLIHVTSFFREHDTVEYLRETVIPKILKSKESGEPVRVWVPACSTGEEAYSLAILFLQAMEILNMQCTLQLFGTDLSETAVAKARLGLYSKSDLVPLGPKVVQRYFTKLDGHYRVAKNVRDLCVFAPHNLFKDPPFSRMDLISCCNLLIYLDPILQKKVMATLHYALNEKGLLILGKSESVGSFPQLFLQIDKKYKIFSRKIHSTKNALLDMARRPIRPTPVRNPEGPIPIRIKPSAEQSMEKSVDNIILSTYVPPGVVVNQDLEIVQFKGDTSLFLQPSAGKASFSLMKMAHPFLAFELRNAVHKANKTREKLIKENVSFKNKDNAYTVTIEVTPMTVEDEEPLFLLMFVDILPTKLPKKQTSKGNALVAHIQAELSNMKDEMRSIIEDQQAAVEELQSANEEVVSSNEELQSINEELETSKEELESTNEELLTINNELQVRNEQLTESYEYAESLFDIIREAVIVLDQEFKIKSANSAFYQIFNITTLEAENKKIFDLNNGQWDIPVLHTILQETFSQNPVISGRKITHTFGKLGEKILVLNVRKLIQKNHQRQLILIAIEDITEHVTFSRAISEREAWFRNLADHAPVMIWVDGKDGGRDFVNSTWLDYTGRLKDQELKEGWKELIHQDDRELVDRTYADSVARNTAYTTQYRLLRHDGQYRWMLESGKPIYTLKDEFNGYLGSSTEIHDHKKMQEELEREVLKRTGELQDANRELERSNNELEQFAYVASHDLQEPLRKILTFSDKLEQFKSSMPNAAFSYVEKIALASDRMTKLIDDLLNYSKLTLEVKQFTEVDLNAVLRNELTDFELVIQEKKALIRIDPLPMIHGIEVQMAQLFHNLLSNALKFVHANVAPHIQITCRENRDYFEIFVKDNGIGFKEEYTEKIFTIFQRLNNRTDYSGTGIGLALCRKIVEFHDGEIFAHSQLGQGTTFHIVLPYKPKE